MWCKVYGHTRTSDGINGNAWLHEVRHPVASPDIIRESGNSIMHMCFDKIPIVDELLGEAAIFGEFASCDALQKMVLE
jgi:hypothetical protein